MLVRLPFWSLGCRLWLIFLPKFGGEGSPFFLLLVGILAGVFLWAFAGYILHCFLFHFPAKPKWEERLAFLFHGIHHEQPRVKTRLMMPLAVSIPLALFFWFLLPGFWPRASFFRLNFTHFCRIYLGLFPV
jgi:hypothetical protein